VSLNAMKHGRYLESRILPGPTHGMAELPSFAVFLDGRP
jgi:hypothetical protein